MDESWGGRGVFFLCNTESCRFDRLATTVPHLPGWPRGVAGHCAVNIVILTTVSEVVGRSVVRSGYYLCWSSCSCYSVPNGPAVSRAPRVLSPSSSPWKHPREHCHHVHLHQTGTSTTSYFWSNRVCFRTCFPAGFLGPTGSWKVHHILASSIQTHCTFSSVLDWNVHSAVLTPKQVSNLVFSTQSTITVISGWPKQTLVWKNILCFWKFGP